MHIKWCMIIMMMQAVSVSQILPKLLWKYAFAGIKAINATTTNNKQLYIENIVYFI